MNIDYVLESCKKASQLLDRPVSVDETELLTKAVQCVEIFSAAAKPDGYKVSSASLREAVDHVFWVTSDDMRPYSSKFPNVLEGYNALRVAAGQFFPTAYPS